jgi:small-conductance mechanosensitive channel
MPMCPALKLILIFMITLGGASISEVSAADIAATLTSTSGTSSVEVSPSDLQELQIRLDRIKQQVSLANTLSQMVGLQDSVQSFINDVDRLQSSLLPEQKQLQAQLDVLGPVAAGDLTPEKSDIAAQRVFFSEQKRAVDANLKALAALRQSGADLMVQIATIRRSLLESEITLRSGSILGPEFWAPMFNPLTGDRERLRDFIEQANNSIKIAWQPGQRLFSVTLMVLALLIWTWGRRLAERGLTWLCIHRMPEGRLRRSTLALASVVATILTTACAMQVLFYALTRQLPLSTMMQNFADEFEKLIYTCVLITGLSRAMLSTKHPSWRLPAISDSVALAIEPFPRLLAGTLLILVGLVQITNVTGMSTPVVLFGRGVIALIVSLILGTLFRRASNVRRAMAASGEAPESSTTLAGVIYSFSNIAVFISLFALLIGYVSLARFITYELVWGFTILSGFYLLMQLLKDSCEYLFSPKSPSGKAFKQSLGIGDVRLEQVSIILSGAGRASLLLLAFISLFVGGVGTTLGQLVSQVFAILGGDGLRKFNIIPGHVFNALLALLIGIYLIRSLRRWLDNELLPKTDMDPGMCASLSTLFANIGYVLAVLLALSSLGVEWTNLAWIVSALSVGIGFGLQEIVKNFVSGLILLTERPVKVGDMISISGVEGDIRRINVRATEIQLSDRSIVIVPNSQLISQNLRNVTLGGSAQGVATLELMFPLDIDPEQVQSLLCDTYNENETILDKPAPYVRFSKLSPEGITLTITGYVSSPRIVGITKSDLLFEILKRLSAAGIELAKPATPA